MCFCFYIKLNCSRTNTTTTKLLLPPLLRSRISTSSSRLLIVIILLRMYFDLLFRIKTLKLLNVPLSIKIIIIIIISVHDDLFAVSQQFLLTFFQSSINTPVTLPPPLLGRITIPTASTATTAAPVVVHHQHIIASVTSTSVVVVVVLENKNKIHLKILQRNQICLL